jgi:hypothetical protein
MLRWCIPHYSKLWNASRGDRVEPSVASPPPTETLEAWLLIAHLVALGRYRRGDLKSASALLSSAAAAEKALGAEKGSLHTLHQARLLAHLEGSLGRSIEYYTQSFRTLQKIRNIEGEALCLRSLGELTLAGRHAERAAAFWVKASQRMGGASLRAEQRTIEIWRTMVQW